MEKVKEILGIAVSWAGVFCFALFTAVSFPSFGTILFLIGLTICLPLRVTRNFWNEKGLRGASKIALIAALIIAGAVMSPRKATETPSDAPEVIEESTPETNDANDTQTQPEQTLEVTESEPVSEPEPVPELEIPENAIVLVAGEKGEYGKWEDMNGESFYAHYLPGGVYSVTNVGKFPAQVNVYEGIRRNYETNLDEYTTSGSVIRLDVGEIGEITVPDTPVSKFLRQSK